MLHLGPPPLRRGGVRRGRFRRPRPPIAEAPSCRPAQSCLIRGGGLGLGRVEGGSRLGFQSGGAWVVEGVGGATAAMRTHPFHSLPLTPSSLSFAQAGAAPPDAAAAAPS